MKAIFIYNFLKYIEWPSDKKVGPFIIGIKDSPELFDEVLLIANIKKVYGNQQVIVKKADDLNEKYHLLFVGKLYKGSMMAIAETAKQNNTLLISDIPGSIKKGVCIELIIAGNQAEFDINKRNLKESKLSVSQQLMDIARNIE
ncbi:MAG: hypothetical protein RLZZ175_989 [Bacteroidota bacterium]|jgi:hypothetical protein